MLALERVCRNNGAEVNLALNFYLECFKYIIAGK